MVKNLPANAGDIKGMGTEWDKEVVGKVDPQKRVLCLAQVFLVIIIEIQCIISKRRLNHPETISHPGPWKNCLPQNWSLVPESLGIAVLLVSVPCEGGAAQTDDF